MVRGGVIEFLAANRLLKRKKYLGKTLNLSFDHHGISDLMEATFKSISIFVQSAAHGDVHTDTSKLGFENWDSCFGNKG